MPAMPRSPKSRLDDLEAGISKLVTGRILEERLAKLLN